MSGQGGLNFHHSLDVAWRPGGAQSHICLLQSKELYQLKLQVLTKAWDSERAALQSEVVLLREQAGGLNHKISNLETDLRHKTTQLSLLCSSSSGHLEDHSSSESPHEQQSGQSGLLSISPCSSSTDTGSGPRGLTPEPTTSASLRQRLASCEQTHKRLQRESEMNKVVLLLPLCSSLFPSFFVLCTI